MNTELLNTLIKLGIGVFIIMLLIAISALLTPKIAKLIERKFPQSPDPERVDKDKDNDNDNPDDVRGPYDKQKEDYDLNYKIYNTDIYGVDLKNGKEKRKNG